MEYFFKPQAVAVVGATPNQYKGGYAILKNLMIGFRGQIYPVNPNYREIEGLPCYRSVVDIPAKVDLVIIFVPAQLVIAALEDCAAKGVPGVIIESSGFAETGAEGKKLQEQLARIAARTGVRIWGPNCMGIVDAVHGQAFSFMAPQFLEGGLTPGKVSMIVQSGMLSAGFLVDIMSHGIMGISKACSIGNKVDVNENDLLAYLMNDPDTEVIALYLESFSDGRRFIELCRQSPKPIVLLKGGKSAGGARAAMSHTASLAGNYSLIRDILAQAHVVEAREFKQMMDISRSLCRSSRSEEPKNGQGVAILAFSGGAGILSSDFLDEFHVPVAELSPPTREALGKLFPAWMPVANPVDLWPAIEKLGAEFDVYSEALKAVMADNKVSAVFIHAVAGAFRIKFDMEAIAKLGSIYGKPVFIWVMGKRDEVFAFQQEASRFGLLAFQDLYRAVECLAVRLHYRPYSPLDSTGAGLMPSLSRESEGLLMNASAPLDEYVSKRILGEIGIPTVEEKIIPEATALEQSVEQFGFPQVMKGIKPELIHKTEHGLVMMNLDSGIKGCRAYRSLMDKMGGGGQVLMQRQLEGKLELIAGYLRDPQFGPCVMLGLGGIMTEVLADRVFSTAPLNDTEALAMIGRLKAQKLLDGFRGSPPVNRDDLIGILMALGNLGHRYPRIKEIDINPLIVSEGRPIAVDASIILEQ
ncbi:MAG: acetate--CoA ligase family protein [Smithellaceae bacterium]|nr:acetate--CoA ligase family protein [Smithellaceae bacterium]